VGAYGGKGASDPPIYVCMRGWALHLYSLLLITNPSEVHAAAGLYHVITYLTSKMIDELMVNCVGSAVVSAIVFYGLKLQVGVGPPHTLPASHQADAAACSHTLEHASAAWHYTVLHSQQPVDCIACTRFIVLHTAVCTWLASPLGTLGR
jgi:hypothetical protein